LTPETDT